MTDKMKLATIFSTIVIIFLVQIFAGTADAEANNDVATEGLRLRVIANSDDEIDQMVKRMAVFAITDFLNQSESGHTMEFLANNLDNIRLRVVKMLDEIGAPTDVEVSFGPHYFPASGNHYPSLVIRLGAAAGENWWCFINPGICIVPNEEYTSINSAQVEVRKEIQENLGTRTINFIGNLFERTERGELAEGEIDWFLFDDEK